MRKKINTTPFNRNKIPPKQNLILMPFLWLFCFLQTRSGKLVIHKERMKGLKPPFLVIGTHHSFTDFYITPLALFPYRANYVSELEGFENFGEWPYRQAGCLGTRKFVDDMALIKNIRHIMRRKGILVLYPEARYANVGTSSEIPQSVAKLTKILKVPVVVINMKGNYLRSPIWNLKTRKEARLETTITKVYTREELEKADIKEIHKTLQSYLSYDEYEWQYDTKQAITYKSRAEGLEFPLYQCPVCKKEFQMESSCAELYCEHCESNWWMTEYGRLEQTNQLDKLSDAEQRYFSHIPNWYNWERMQVQEEIERGEYSLEISVQIESLPNAVNFIHLGKGLLRHNKDGFALTFTDYNETEEKTLTFTPITTFSVHTEYNYRNKGQCITLSTLDNTYFLFPLEEGFNATKIQFATEYLYKLAQGNIRGELS